MCLLCPILSVFTYIPNMIESSNTAEMLSPMYCTHMSTQSQEATWRLCLASASCGDPPPTLPLLALHSLCKATCNLPLCWIRSFCFSFLSILGPREVSSPHLGADPVLVKEEEVKKFHGGTYVLEVVVSIHSFTWWLYLLCDDSILHIESSLLYLSPTTIDNGYGWLPLIS